MALSTENVVMLSQLESFKLLNFHALNELSGEEKLGRGDLEALVRAHGPELGMSQRGIQRMSEAFDRGDEILTVNARHGIRTLSLNDWDYPNLLRKVADPPLLLHVKGDVKLLNENPAITVVGSREASEHGAAVAEQIGHQLGEQGINVVSGLAKGIDGRAHSGALDGSGRTTAVLAHGLGMIYPREHENLATRIIGNGGALVSEHPFHVAPDHGTFIDRNRIQAGLSEATVVVEAEGRSGTMQTARHVQRYDRLLGVYDPGLEARVSLPDGNKQLLGETGTVSIKPGAELASFLQQAGIDVSQGLRLRR
jgi:DNA processing protein